MTTYTGRIWLILEDGNLMDDIDTDMIYHNKYLAITDKSQMGQYTFDNLKGYEDFAKKAQPGDIIIVGGNFGSGSSRQQAVDCFDNLGVICVMAQSYGAIYKRNAINSGYPIIVIKELDTGGLADGDEISIDTDSCTIEKDGLVIGKIEQMSSVQKDILGAGNIFEYAKGL
ncbi:MAG: 3-isopropylmalate dehydratase [Thermoplasmata archaeon]|nr:3-isopropylmalate dehydratase [Thermoplasmata archaeon]